MNHKTYTSNRSWSMTLLAVTTLIITTGCSNAPEKTYPVHGQVTLNGKALNGGTILFEPRKPASSGKYHAARGHIDIQGEYKLSTFTPGDGAVAGRHRVTILPSRNTGDGTPSSNYPPLPGKYASLETTSLQFEVTNINNEINITLTTDK